MDSRPLNGQPSKPAKGLEDRSFNKALSIQPRLQAGNVRRHINVPKIVAHAQHIQQHSGWLYSQNRFRKLERLFITRTALPPTAVCVDFQPVVARIAVGVHSKTTVADLDTAPIVDQFMDHVICEQGWLTNSVALGVGQDANT